MWHVVKLYATKAGFAGLAPHDLRRSCAKLCHSAGGELEQIQFLLGHVSVQTTERYLGCNSAFVVPSMIASVSNHSGHLLQTNVSPTSRPTGIAPLDIWRKPCFRFATEFRYRVGANPSLWERHIERQICTRHWQHTGAPITGVRTMTQNPRPADTADTSSRSLSLLLGPKSLVAE